MRRLPLSLTASALALLAASSAQAQQTADASDVETVVVTGSRAAPRAQLHHHLRRYMNWIPAEFVDAMAPTTGWAGTGDELRRVLHEFEAVGTDEVHLIPTSADLTQLRAVAEVAAEFG